MNKVLLVTLGLFLSFSAVFAQDKIEPLDKDLSSVKYPFEVSFFEFESQKQPMKMAYMDVKPFDGNGRTVLLLHGKNFNGAYWERTIAELGGKGFRVIVPDQVGFGKSTKPQNYQYSFHQLAANTSALLEHLKVKKVIVVGHSMGGILAARFALMHPEMTEKLVLENPIGLEDYKTFATYQIIDQAYKAELKNSVESYKNYQLKFYYDNKWKPEYDRWLALLAGWTLHKDYPIIAWNAALTADMIFTQPVVYEFKNVKTPTLLILGTRDRTAIGKDRAPKHLQPEMGRYDRLGKTTQAKIAGSKLVELDNIGHLPHIEDFERFFRALTDFIEE